MKLSEISVVRRIKDEIEKEPFILSHHPLCKRYEKHVVTIRGYKVCMGCLFTYSSAIATIILVNLFVFTGLYGYIDLFYTGLFFFGIALIRKIFLDDEKLSKKVHVLFRIFLGISLGFEITAIQYSSGKTRIFLTTFIVAVIITYNVMNWRKTRKICTTCEQYDRFPKCDGFVIPDHYRKHRD